MFVKALREMANPNGSSIQSVERHIRKVYSVEVDTGYMLEGKKSQTKIFNMIAYFQIHELCYRFAQISF